MYSGPMIAIFSQNGRYLREYDRADLFFRFLKVHCYGNQFYGKIWVCAFILHNGVPKQIAISPFWFKNIQCQYFVYTVCKFDEDRSTNTRLRDWTFLDETAKIRISHRISQQLLDELQNKFSALIDVCMTIIKLM